ncbi:uncharacterized protein PG998_010377 [Apiospora kogelbergensis]|uniref:uncharacterized protein n=1 Tax=Apiospora kogelbergensis TaxID=1337665 RepID=UPI003131DC36
MDAFTIEAFALLGIGLAVIGLRTYWRLSTVGIRNLKADDYLMLLAAVVYSAETYLAYSVGKLWHGLANNGMTDDERRLLDPSSEEYRLRVGGSKTQIAGWSTYTFLLWVLKAAMCTFYIRLTDADFCQPAISKVDIFVTVVLNVVTDLYLLTIPIPMLWQSSIKPVKKVALIVMFSGGVFVTAAGVLRCVLIITNPVTGAQQAGSWAVRETFVAVITTNLPMVFPMFRIWLYPIAGTVRQYSSRALSHLSKDSRSGITGGSTKPQQLGGAFSLDDRNPRRGKGVRSVDHITGLTFSESEERLYDQNHSPTGKVPVSAETRRYSTQYPSV